MATINDIQSANFQLSVKGVGEIAENLEDIQQCISVIISTPKGSVPFRQGFGSNVYQYADKLTTDVLSDVAREVRVAVDAFEPRVKVNSVSAYINPDDEEKRQVLVSVGATLLYNSQQVSILYNLSNIFAKVDNSAAADPNTWIFDNNIGWRADSTTVITYE